MKKHERPTIEAQPRPRTGTVYAQRLRRGGRLPGVIYGHQRPPVAISVDEKEMLTHLRRGAHVLTLEVAGAKPETVLVKELQFGYLGDNVIHVDFTRVDLQQEVRVAVHLIYVGRPKAAIQAGAVVSHDITSLEVICRVDDIPQEIRVDLAAMGEGTVLTIGDLALPPGVRAAGDPATPVTHISFIRQEEEAAGEAVEVAAEPSEPEVITEAKAEEGEEEEEQAKGPAS